MVLVQKEIKKITIRPNGTEKQIRPASTPWTPGANTLAYYPLDGDIDDHSGNGYNMSIVFGTAAYGTLASGKKYGTFNATGNVAGGWGCQTSSKIAKPTSVTVSYWGIFNGNKSWIRDVVTQRDTNGYIWMNNITTGGGIMFHGNSQYTSSGTITDNTWHNIICVVNSGTVYFYVDGSLSSSTSYSFGAAASAKFAIGYAGGPQDERLVGNVADIIIENKARTATEILDYYNLTKADYGL